MTNVALPPYNVLSLCAGSGALDLGIAIARPGARTVCYVERGAYQAELLAARMEAGDLHEAPIWGDLGTFDGGPWRGVVDCVASGDPCQGNSLAGKRLGAEDDRWLLDRVLDIVDAVRPETFFRENVPGNANGQLDALVPALERMGYRVAGGVFSALELPGHGQERERLYVMAHRDGAGPQVAEQPGQPGPEEREFEPRSTARQLRGLRASPALVDADGGGDQGLATDAGQRALGRTAPEWAGDLPLLAPRPRDRRWVDIVRNAPGLKPAVHRLAYGPTDRLDRVGTAGNAVMPLVAARAWLGLEGRLAAGAAD